MIRTLRTVLPGLLLAAWAWPAFGAQSIVPAERLETLTIQGISLATPPRQAFDHLRSLGFRAGNIDTFEAWEGDGLEWVRGSGSDPQGLSRIMMVRQDGVLTSIQETWNWPKGRFEAADEIGRVRAHLGIAADDAGCKVASHGNGGSCVVRDTADPHQVRIGLTMSVVPTMRMSTLRWW